MKKKFTFRAQIFFLGLVFVSLVGIGVFVWLQYKRKPKWSNNWREVLQNQDNHKPMILAIVKQSCNDETQTNCPTPDQMDLSEFRLAEVLYGSRDYIELGYDDRFTPDREDPPVFFLLNPDGEIRDVKKKFPDPELLERWKRIR